MNKKNILVMLLVCSTVHVVNGSKPEWPVTSDPAKSPSFSARCAAGLAVVPYSIIDTVTTREHLDYAGTAQLAEYMHSKNNLLGERVSSKTVGSVVAGLRRAYDAVQLLKKDKPTENQPSRTEQSAAVFYSLCTELINGKATEWIQKRYGLTTENNPTKTLAIRIIVNIVRNVGTQVGDKAWNHE